MFNTALVPGPSFLYRFLLFCDAFLWVSLTGVRELTRSLVTLPPKVDPGAFNGQRHGWKTPKRTLWQGLCV